MEIVYSDHAPEAIGPYSQAIIVDGYVFASGQIAISPQTGELINGDIIMQTEQVCRNLQAILQQAEVGFGNVIKTTCFLANMEDFPRFNEVYAKYFTGKPARSCVAVKSLPKNALVEVEVIAKIVK